MGDLDRISLYNNYQHNIKQTSNEKKKNLHQEIIGWSNTKFSKQTSQELYGRQ